MYNIQKRFGAVLALAAAVSALPSNCHRAECPGDFRPVSAADYVASMNPGWNLGNTLDAVPNEGSWNNAPVVAKTFDDVKAGGFKSVRIPVTYADHYISGSPSWTIDPTWLQRVSDVVDMATERGLYVLTNMHHDSGWLDVTKSDANVTMMREKLYRSWLQIGQKLACKSSLVSLEPINEPPANTAEDGALINEFNGIFLDALAESGGFNTQRVVTLVGGSMDASKTSQWFKKPENVRNPWALQFHYYSPYDFIFSAWGKTIWGSEEDKKTVRTDLDIVRGNFSDVPLIIGEFDAALQNTESAARRKWLDFVIREAAARDTAVIVWDNGDAYLNRPASQWNDPVANDIIMNAARGIPNALADSTVDPSALTQSSSAFIFNRVGEEVTDRTVEVQFNGNTLEGITVTGGEKLQQPADYTVSGSIVTIKSGFLSRFISESASPGSKANLTLTFSAGAPVQVEIVQWDTPELASTSSVAVAGSDLRIPITFKGLPKLATVKMVKLDDTYLADDWTKWLPPLQQGRGTFNSHWRWDNEHVILTSTAVDAVIASGLKTWFMFEFYPRQLANSVNYTLEVA